MPLSQNYHSSSSSLVLLDSNILQYSVSKLTASVFNAYLEELKQREYDFAISSISIYELLAGANIKTKKIIAAVLNTFEKYPITDAVLKQAIQLEDLYKQESIMPNQANQGDKFIAATSILTNARILTANARDFPFPFFREEEREILEFETQRKRYGVLAISLLRPDIEIINKKLPNLA